MNGGVLFGLGLAQSIALLMSTAFLAYVAIIVVPYLRYRPRGEGDAARFDWHFFVPCRDEEVVIGRTLDHLLTTFPAAHVWVVDDDSADTTTAEVLRRSAACARVHLVRRFAPDARQGKGAALNAAYAALDAFLPATADRGRIVVGVVDADGWPAENALRVCAADHLFGNPRTASVQIAVRMVNRDDPTPRPGQGRVANWWGRTLVRMQDVEFRAPIAAIQLTRARTRTVGLGGNGQFSRLSALDDVRRHFGTPWHGALLEDYELSLHLMLLGHTNAYTMDAVVDQEGLPTLRRLLTQRTRWGQGTMQCASYLPKLWRTRNIPTLGVVETSYYLLQPWMQILGTIVYPVPLAILGWEAYVHAGALSAWLAQGGWLLAVLYFVLGIGPLLLWGPVYRRRCEPGVGVLRGIGFGVAYTAFISTFYITSWRALYRIVRRRRGWTKTGRNAETFPLPAAPLRG